MGFKADAGRVRPAFSPPYISARPAARLARLRTGGLTFSTISTRRAYGNAAMPVNGINIHWDRGVILPLRQGVNGFFGAGARKGQPP